jgi:hypothetical protein
MTKVTKTLIQDIKIKKYQNIEQRLLEEAVQFIHILWH